MRFFRHAALVAYKDLRIELRTREIIYTTLFFAVMVVLIFSFAIIKDGQVSADVTAGILWSSVAFSGVFALGRAFERERERGTMRGLLLSPADRGAVFLGKSVSVILFMLLVELFLAPLMGLFFDAPLLAHPFLLALLLVLTTIGFGVVGSVFAAMLLPSRMRGVLLPVVLYPIVMPALIAGSKGTVALFAEPAQLSVARFWISFLVVYDALFIAVALWAFESLVIE